MAQDSQTGRLPFGQCRRERYQHGYPLYSALIGHLPEFQNFRRFRDLRMRLLLIKQDQISQLEKKLHDIDANEEAELYLGSCRLDANSQRAEVLQQLEAAFSVYDDFLQRSHWAIDMPNPDYAHVRTMRNWVDKTGNIARSERAYLDADEDWDLLSISAARDASLPKFISTIEGGIGYLTFWLQKIAPNAIAVDSDLINASRPVSRVLARVLTVSLAIILLLIPIIALNATGSTPVRFVIIFVAASLFVTLITLASAVKFAEIFAAGAAYAAVLVVFVSGNGVSG